MSMSPSEVFLCRYKKCSKLVGAKRDRFPYTSSNGRLVHERHREYHHDCPASTCERCTRLKDKWITVKRKGDLKCRHFLAALIYTLTKRAAVDMKQVRLTIAIRPPVNDVEIF